MSPVEKMKNKSRYKTLILPAHVYKMLTEAKAQQKLYKKMYKISHGHEYVDSVCVNQLGEILKPSYVTEHFRDTAI